MFKLVVSGKITTIGLTIKKLIKTETRTVATMRKTIKAALA